MKLLFYTAAVVLLSMLMTVVDILYFLIIFRDWKNESVKLSFHFTGPDSWIGAMYDRKRRILYFCPFPMMCIAFELVPARPVRPGGNWPDIPELFL